MIKSNVFYEALDAGLASVLGGTTVERLPGKPAKYRLRTGAGDLHLWLRVNSKVSAMPYLPGEFWPEISAPETLRSRQGHDSGDVSWYQYSTEEQNAAFKEQQSRVRKKVAAQKTFENEFYRQMRNSRLSSLKALIADPLLPQHPHKELIYLDADDAHAWGTIFAEQLPSWLDRFTRAPETLNMYMWRVHWAEAPA